MLAAEAPGLTIQTLGPNMMATMVSCLAHTRAAVLTHVLLRTWCTHVVHVHMPRR